MSIHETPATAGKERTKESWMGQGNRSWQSSRAGIGRTSIVQPGCTKLMSCRRKIFSRPLSENLPAKYQSLGRLSTSNSTRARVPIVEQAIETAALMLGSDRSRGYCLEMICADFLAGANLDNADPETLLFSMTRFFRLLPEDQKQTFLESLDEKAS